MTSRAVVSALISTFLGCATAPEPRPAPLPARAYANELSEFDGDCVNAGPCHSYRFNWPTGSTVRVRVTSKTAQLKLFSMAKHQETITLTTDGTAEQTIVTTDKQVTIRVAGTKSNERGEYTLELDPGPTREVAAPRSLEKLQAQRDARAAELGARQAKLNARADAKAQKEAACAGGNRVYAATSNGQGDVRYQFCDGSTVHQTKAGKWSVSMALSGDDYDTFMQRERATLEVASHNAEVLKTHEWQRRASLAEAAYDERSAAFAAKYRKPESWYVAEAKRSTGSVVPQH